MPGKTCAAIQTVVVFSAWRRTHVQAASLQVLEALAWFSDGSWSCTCFCYQFSHEHNGDWDDSALGLGQKSLDPESFVRRYGEGESSAHTTRRGERGDSGVSHPGHVRVKRTPEPEITQIYYKESSTLLHLC